MKIKIIVHTIILVWLLITCYSKHLHLVKIISKKSSFRLEIQNVVITIQTVFISLLREELWEGCLCITILADIFSDTKSAKKMSKRKKSVMLIDSESDESDSGDDLDEVMNLM